MPDFAKRLVKNGLLKGKKREPHVRYVYTHVPGDESGPQKTPILRKASHKAPPNDLVQLLIEKKHQMYEKEMKMQAVKEMDDQSLRETVAEFQSSEEEADFEENFSWYKDPDNANYFILSTLLKNMIEKDK